jgi:hypothetical protein
LNSADFQTGKRSRARTPFSAGTSHWKARCLRDQEIEEATMGRGLLLWLLGVPIPVIILLWLFFGR